MVSREREREVLVRHWLVPQAVARSQGSHIDVSVMGSNVDSDHEMFFTSIWDLLASPDKWPVEEDSLPDNLYQPLMKSFHFVGGDNDITALVNLIFAIAFEMKYLIKRWIRSKKSQQPFHLLAAQSFSCDLVVMLSPFRSSNMEKRFWNWIFPLLVGVSMPLPQSKPWRQRPQPTGQFGLVCMPRCWPNFED